MPSGRQHGPRGEPLFQRNLFPPSVSSSLFSDLGPQNRSFSFFIADGFSKECQGPRALIFSEAGHGIIWFHCTHIFRDPWLCARMVLSVKRADMNQTWCLDLSFKVWRGERQKDKTQRHIHTLSEGQGSSSSFPGGFRWALQAKEGLQRPRRPSEAEQMAQAGALDRESVTGGGNQS